jgi:hypothetical protein
VRVHHLRSSIPSSLVSLFDVVVVVVVVVSTLAHRGSFTLGVSKKRVVREQQNSIQQTTTQNNNKQTKIEKKKIKTTSSSSSSSSLRTGHKRGVAHTHVRTVVRLPVEHAIARVHQSERDERSFLHVRRRVGRE